MHIKYNCRESYGTACATRRGRAVSYVRLDRGHESTQKEKIGAVSVTEADVAVFKACVCSLHVNIRHANKSMDAYMHCKCGT